MMEFLKSLAPQRSGDGGRAVALLPPRFAGGGPLQGLLGQPTEPDAGVENLLAPGRIPTRALAAPVPQSAQPLRVTARETAAKLAAVPEPLAESGNPPSPATAASATGSSFPTRTEGGPTSRGSDPPFFARRASPTAASTPQAAPAATHRAGPIARAASRTVMPLSAASLAERVAKGADTEAAGEPPEVHVSIGRIEVIAQVTPRAPAPRTAERKPSLTLSDFLRGDSGGHR
jgi:hypothetical protein